MLFSRQSLITDVDANSRKNFFQDIILHRETVLVPLEGKIKKNKHSPSIPIGLPIHVTGEMLGEWDH